MRPCAIRHNPTFPVATSYTIGSSGVFFCLISYPTASILQYWLARTQRNCLLLAQCCDSVPSAVLVSVCTSSCLYISLWVKIGRVEVLKWSYQAVADRFEIPTAGHHRRLVTTEPGRTEILYLTTEQSLKYPSRLRPCGDPHQSAQLSDDLASLETRSSINWKPAAYPGWSSSSFQPLKW